MTPADPSAEERLQVLDGLEHLPHFARQRYFLNRPVLDNTAVGDTDVAADRDGFFRILHIHAGHPDQRILLQQRIGIDRRDERIMRQVDAGIQRIGLAAVGLVDDVQMWILRVMVHRRNRLAVDRVTDVRIRQQHQLEFVPQHPQRVVLGPVVNHDHFVSRIIQGQEAFDVFDDRDLLVKSRHQQRNRRYQFGTGQRVVFRIGSPAEDRKNLPERKGHDRKINQVDRHDVIRRKQAIDQQNISKQWSPSSQAQKQIVPVPVPPPALLVLASQPAPP
ncbi:hypothetical protein D3C81_1009150 [compost metagenome]